MKFRSFTLNTRSLSIKKRVNYSVLVIALVSIAVIGLLSYFNSVRQVKEGLKDLAENQNRLFHSIVSMDSQGLSRAHSGLTRIEQLLGLFAAGSRDPLLAASRPLFEEIKQNDNITHMYFIKPDGTVLLRVHKPEQSGDKLTRATFEQAAATGKVSSGIEMGKNFFSLRSVKPVSYQGRKIGFMEVAEEIDHIFTEMKAINGVEVSLFLTEEFLRSKNADLKSDRVGDFRVLYPTDKETALKLATASLPAMKEALQKPLIQVVSGSGGKYVIGLGPVQDASGATVGILFSHKNVTPVFAAIWRGLLVNMLVITAIVAISIGILFLSLRKSLKLFEELRRHVVQVTSTWDFSSRIRVETKDEIGQLAGEFNQMIQHLGEIVDQVKQSGTELNVVSENIHQASGQVRTAAERQAGSVDETSSAITEINASIREVAHGVDGLSHAASETSSSILEMVASVEEVALNTESLGQSVEEVSSSINQMTTAIKQVASNVGDLLESASITSTSIMEMDSSIHEVEKTALDTATISEGVKEDAETGRAAVEATIAGIDAIKRSSGITSEVIENLSSRARDIGNILSVINEVAGQTNLLALNAAIIAAQAGEYGKGFAVVAEEIKGLADRTSSSTQEIAEVIKGVQDETGRAVQAIAMAEKSIAEGESLSRKSGEALNKIVAGAQTATRQVNLIARATTEQAKGSQMIRDAMENITAMVGQIAAAAREQGQGSEQIMAAVEQMEKITSQVRNATREQTTVGNFIAKSTEDITGMIRQIKRACDEQSKGSRLILPAMERIQDSAESNLEAVRLLSSTLDTLSREIDSLNSGINRFTAEEQ